MLWRARTARSPSRLDPCAHSQRGARGTDRVSPAKPAHPERTCREFAHDMIPPRCLQPPGTCGSRGPGGYETGPKSSKFVPKNSKREEIEVITTPCERVSRRWQRIFGSRRELPHSRHIGQHIVGR